MRRLFVALLLLLIPAGVISMPDEVLIPIVKKHEKGDPPEAATFSHWSHDQYYCSRCHPSVFPQAPLGFTHADIKKGRFCGNCHNGRTSFAIEDPKIECELCHVER